MREYANVWKYDQMVARKPRVGAWGAWRVTGQKIVSKVSQNCSEISESMSFIHFGKVQTHYTAKTLFKIQIASILRYGVSRDIDRDFLCGISSFCNRAEKSIIVYD